jgi:hypothetical protein
LYSVAVTSLRGRAHNAFIELSGSSFPPIRIGHAMKSE